MGQVLLLLVVALTVAAVVFGVTVLVSGRDPGLVPAEPDGRSVPLPASRPLAESDVGEVRFDTAPRATAWPRSTTRCAGRPTTSATSPS